MRCADNCPTGALSVNEAMRRQAVINPNKCDDCGDCAKVCQYEAIAHDAKGRHTVAAWNCTGCGACAKECKHGAMQMMPGTRFKR
jgi:electron transport complex protein RnfB